MAVKAVPEGLHTVTPYLVVQGVAKLIEFLKQAFGATEMHRSTRPDGTVMHAQVKIGDSPIMMGEAWGDYSPKPASLYLYVPAGMSSQARDFAKDADVRNYKVRTWRRVAGYGTIVDEV